MNRQLKTLTGEGHQSSSGDDEIIMVAEDHNKMPADGDDRKKNLTDQQNVEDGQHVPNNKENVYNIRDLVDNIVLKLGNAPPSSFAKRHCIFRIHERVREISKSAYTPHLVSIGPFHHGDTMLQAMEKYKLIYMRDMLSRCESKTTGCTWATILEECIKSIKIMEKEVRSCYSEPINFPSEEFAEMMVVDSLFIVELFLRTSGRVKSDPDPICYSNNHLILGSLCRDVALLENQLPLFVIDRLFEIPALRQEIQGYSVSKLGLLFLNALFPRDEVQFKLHSKNKCYHLLDLFGQSLHPLSPVSTRDMFPSFVSVPTATDLKNAGVRFKKGTSEKSLLDIKFSDGVLQIPPLDVQDDTETLLRNLIAYEQYYVGDSSYFTAYAIFMDSLINSGNDVRVLSAAGIIHNRLGSDEGVSNLFNNLCREIVIKTAHYIEIEDQVTRYYKKRRHKWRAILIRDYFNTPWAIISVIAAFLLLALTMAQTIFSAESS